MATMFPVLRKVAFICIAECVWKLHVSPRASKVAAWVRRVAAELEVPVDIACWPVAVEIGGIGPRDIAVGAHACRVAHLRIMTAPLPIPFEVAHLPVTEDVGVQIIAVGAFGRQVLARVRRGATAIPIYVNLAKGRSATYVQGIGRTDEAHIQITKEVCVAALPQHVANREQVADIHLGGPQIPTTETCILAALGPVPLIFAINATAKFTVVLYPAEWTPSVI
mmetsp:Transcript_22365/g.47747  ORF Transcript_22365/g.47747 Transcript_22365/m.47747 type:complete len:223 (+) Transcript_22365:1349-2017(+)